MTCHSERADQVQVALPLYAAVLEGGQQPGIAVSKPRQLRPVIVRDYTVAEVSR